jgi:katanin p60 ATPase-containing subunit A1
VGYSGSDVKLVCKEAAMQPVRKVFDQLETMTSRGSGLGGVALDPITTQDVEAAISRTKPSAKLLAKRYSDWQNQYGSI